MPQTFGIIHLHVIFSTKAREPFLANRDRRGTMHAYLAGALAKMDCPALTVGGASDHVHILCRLSRDKPISAVLRDLKKGSSHWARQQGNGMWKKFAWQQGYAAFSVGVSGVSRTRKYIERQEEHHRGVGFEEEYMAFLRKHGVGLGEHHTWD